jgi:hypothetical protein
VLGIDPLLDNLGAVGYIAVVCDKIMATPIEEILLWTNFRKTISRVLSSCGQPVK